MTSFMLTLCRLDAPVSLRPPRSPHLKPFKFFTSRARQPDGTERLYLHMGYFQTLNDAERWAQIARGRYPDAIATVAPAAFLRPPKSEQDKPLTDTQVLNILEARRVVKVQDDADERNCDQIALLRPDDTSTRLALKEAVARGAPVSFALQLHWSEQPIDLNGVPSLVIFKGHTLYATENRREGRSHYFLRLGFFADPGSAREMAVQARSHFPSAAVVPVAEQEVTRARAAGRDTSSIPCLVPQEVRAPDSSSTRALPRESQPLSDIPRRAVRGAETLEQTLEQLAERELWTDPDSLSDTGVRHLRVEVQKRRSRR